MYTSKRSKYSFSEIYLQHFGSAQCDGHVERSRSTTYAIIFLKNYRSPMKCCINFGDVISVLILT